MLWVTPRWYLSNTFKAKPFWCESIWNLRPLDKHRNFCTSFPAVEFYELPMTCRKFTIKLWRSETISPWKLLFWLSWIAYKISCHRIHIPRLTSIIVRSTSGRKGWKKNQWDKKHKNFMRCKEKKGKTSWQT